MINDLCRIDEDHIASACADNNIRVFDLSSKSFDKPKITLEQNESAPNHICSMSQHTLLTSGYDCGVRIWDIRTQSSILSFKKIHYD